MKPDTGINYKTILQHLLFWAAYMIYLSFSHTWDEKDEVMLLWYPQFLTAIPIAILFSYINLYWLMPRFYYRHRYAGFTVALICLIICGGLFERFSTYAIWVPWDKVHDPVSYVSERKDFWIFARILKGCVKVASVIFITMFIKLMRNAVKNEHHLRELEKEKMTAEMGLLKAQLNPHFFFNTLNSLYALTFKESPRASNMVLRLSDLMNYMLYKANAPMVLLKDEIDHLESYISIEQMRFADRLDLSFQYSGDLDHKMIAPLLLMPFVENAFKHGLTENNAWITINLKVIDNHLYLNVKNSYQETAAPKSGGLGLANVIRRLRLSYLNRHELLQTQVDGVFESNLKIDL